MILAGEQKEWTVFKNLVKICCFIVVFGCLLRLFEITQKSFVFYDEGMYLRYNAELLEKIQQYPPKDIHEFFAIVKILFLSALTTAKWLWFLMSNVRVFWGGPEAYFFTRVISSFSGLLTIWLTYKTARQLFRSREIACLSAAVLAVLPSHVFYSRLAMQEAFSTLCFLSGIYLYLTGRKNIGRLAACTMFLSAVYFTNYRMIVLPVLLFVFEWMLSLGEKRKINWIKWGVVCAGFAGWVLFFGLLNKGSNLFITSAWMGKQAQMATQSTIFFNVFTYPVEILTLEGALLFLMLLVNVYFVFKREWMKVLPIAVVCVQIGIFTLASEKGARYLCVVLPFMAMAGALGVWGIVSQRDYWKTWARPVVLSLFFLALMVKSVSVVATPNGYQKAIAFVQQRNPDAKVLTTQPLVLSLFTERRMAIESVPKSFDELLIRYAQGYRYLILDPQAYISWTQSGGRFTFPLVDYLGFVSDRINPSAVFSHLKPALLERFVWDHSENLKASMSFLKQSPKDLGAVYVYELDTTIPIMQKAVERMNAQLRKIE